MTKPFPRTYEELIARITPDGGKDDTYAYRFAKGDQLFAMDWHYEADRFATKNKAHDFNA